MFRSRLITELITTVGLIFAPRAVWAAPEGAASSGGYLSGYTTTDPVPTAVSWWSTLAYLFSLLLVFAVVVVLAYWATRFVGGQISAGNLNNSKILEQLPVSPKHSVCVIEMAGRVFMIGIADHSVNLLAEITDEEEIDRLRRQSLARPLMGGSFSHQIGSLADLMQKIPPFRR